MRPWYLNFFDFCPGGRLSQEAYKVLYTYNTKNAFKVSPRSPKCNFMIRPCKPKWIERKKYETLSSSSKNFWSQKTYKGSGGRRPPPPPLYVFSATQNCSDWCLSLVFLPFNPFWLAGAKHKITFWGPWTYFKNNSYVLFVNLT